MIMQCIKVHAHLLLIITACILLLFKTKTTKLYICIINTCKRSSLCMHARRFNSIVSYLASSIGSLSPTKHFNNSFSHNCLFQGFSTVGPQAKCGPEITRALLYQWASNMHQKTEQLSNTSTCDWQMMGGCRNRAVTRDMAQNNYHNHFFHMSRYR